MVERQLQKKDLLNSYETWDDHIEAIANLAAGDRCT